MPVEYTRDPVKLSYDDYKSWIRDEVLKFLTDHQGDSDFPSHIVPDLTAFAAMIDAYVAAFNPYFNLIQLANGKNKLVTAAAKTMSEKLQQIKYALPTIEPDPDILAQFSLAKEIPVDRDLLLTVAENALAHWATVSADPKFAPVVGDFDALQILYDDTIAKQTIYVDTEDQRQATQNAVLSTRAALHEVERKVFNWYRSRHPKGQDEWWTYGPWGKTSGGSGGGAVPENVVFKIDLMAKEFGLYGDEVEGSKFYEIEVRQGTEGDWQFYAQREKFPMQIVPPGIGSWWFRIRAVDSEGEPGGYSDEVKFDFPEALAPVSNLTFTLTALGGGEYHGDGAWDLVVADGYSVIIDTLLGRDPWADIVFTNAFDQNVALDEEATQAEVSVIALRSDGAFSVGTIIVEL